MRRPTRQELERVFRHVERREGPDACLVWTGVTCQGYGQVRIRGERRYVHRFVWEVFRGPIPTGFGVCHRCDNRACVRPTHLELREWLVGEHHPNATLTDELVLDMRAVAREGAPVIEIAQDLGMPYSTVYQAIRGEHLETGTWKHLPDAVPP